VEYDRVLMRVARAYPIMVTPFSQVVVAQAR
jgi:hypothetical protein